MIKISGIFKNFSSITILNDISISFNRKEFFFILGPSGSGKTTLLNIIGGLQMPDNGKVYYDDIDIFSISEKKRNILRTKNIGYLFQFHYLIEDYSCIENMIIPLIINGFSYNKAKEKANRLLKEFSLEDIATKKAAIISGGQKQKIAMLRAIITEPEILLCDEPTGNLDSDSSKEFIHYINEFHKRKNGIVIIVTHNRDILEYVDIPYKIINILDGNISLSS